VDDAEARKRARVNWPIRRFDLGAEPGDDLSATTTAEARLAMMWELAVNSWRLSGKCIPDYSREDMPIRILRLQDLK